MLLCSLTRFPVLQACRDSLRISSRTSHNIRSFVPILARAFSSENNNPPLTKTPNDFPSPAHKTLTLLHKATTLLPRAFNIKRISGSTRPEETADFWNVILSNIYEDLSATTKGPAKIVVCGVDEWSGAQEVLTALLADPLTNTGPQFDSLNNRWSDATQERVEISYGTTLDGSSSSLQLQSSYLAQFDVPIQITELRMPTAYQSKRLASLSSVLENPAIFTADIPIIVCNPITMPLSTILAAPLPHNTILVLSSSVPQADLDEIIQQQLSASPPHHGPPFRRLKTISVDPKRAVGAIHTLQSDRQSLTAIQRFQDDFIGSKISTVTHALHDKLKSNTSMSPLLSLRTKAALYRIQDALCACLASVRELRHDLNQASIDASNLRAKIEEVQARVEGDVFGGRPGDKTAVDEVAEAIRLAEAEMRLVMDRLTWWRMVWKVDEISSIVGHALARTWCQALEKKLILHTGRLSTLQQSLTESAFLLFSTHQNVPSAVLRNTLLQLKGRPKFPLTPESLTQPLFTRRDQILEYPTMRLHIAGQRVVFVMSGGVATGVGISWAGWLGWLLGSGEGLLGFVGMDAGTAIGVGMLSAVASIRWAVGKWEKSKKRWWQDWSRVGEGLDRDLRVRRSMSPFVYH
ncbi:hypothetical protein BYT27DRAFT_7250731 [Phlegmacium glaucopus]|nr:hypothetical protein BYT27DRAFT_7250731 [Phlegmacium glaucopus]